MPGSQLDTRCPPEALYTNGPLSRGRPCDRFHVLPIHTQVPRHEIYRDARIRHPGLSHELPEILLVALRLLRGPLCLKLGLEEVSHALRGDRETLSRRFIPPLSLRHPDQDEFVIDQHVSHIANQKRRMKLHLSPAQLVPLPHLETVGREGQKISHLHALSCRIRNRV